MESTATPPWEAKKKTAPRGLLRKVVIWGLGIGFLALAISSLQPKPIPVETATVGRGSLTVYVVEEGKTRIRNRYIVAAPVGGNMRRVALKPGDEVKANETLLTVIEPGLAPLLDARTQAQTEARIQSAEAAQSRAHENLAMTKTAAQFATANWERVKKNIGEGSISVTDRENIELAAQMRDREVRAAEFALKVADYELAQAKAALLSLTTPGSGAVVEVRAPVSGRVLKVQQESAMMISPGAPILEIGDPADLEIEAEILSRDAVGMKPGAEVVVEQWGGDLPLKARIRRVEPAAFTKVSALGVEEQRVIVLSDLDPLPPEARMLGDRYRVEVRVEIWCGADELLVPGGAIFREGAEWMSFVAKDGRAVKKTVQVGRTDGRMAQVLGGLEAGMFVLMHPPDSVVDGAEIVVKMEKPE